MKHLLLVLTTFLALTHLFVSAQSRIFSKADTALANNLIKEGFILATKSKNAEALIKLDSAQNILENFVGVDSLVLAEVYRQKGGIYRETNKYDEAIVWHNKALALRKKKLGYENVLVAQSLSYLATLYRLKGESKKSLDYLLQSTHIREKVLPENNRLLLTSYNNLGFTYVAEDDFANALLYDQKALNFLLKFEPENMDYIAKQYGNIAVVFDKTGQYTTAETYYQKALEIQRKIYKTEGLDISYTYNNLATLNNSLGDYDKAIEFLYKALNIQLNIPNNKKVEIDESYRNLGISYLNKQDYDKAILYFSESAKIVQKIKGVNFPEFTSAYNNIGSAFFKKGSIDSAMYYFQFALDTRSKFSPDADLETAKYLSNLSLCYDFQKNYDKAIELANKSLKINEKFYGKESSNLTINYNALALIYAHKKDTEKALAFLDKTSALCKYSQKKDFTSVENKTEMVQALKMYSLIYLDKFEKTNEVKYLESATNFADQALNGINLQEETLNSESAKSLLKNSTFDMYETAIQANYALASFRNRDSLLASIFQLSEQSKARYLQSQISNAYALAYAGIPEELLQQEAALRQSIAHFEKIRQEKLDAGKSEIDSTILAISSNVFETRKQYDSLKNEMARQYPEYYRLKYNLKTPTISEVQQNLLASDQTLVEYFVGDSAIYILNINQNAFNVVKLDKDKALDSLVRGMRDGLARYHGNIIDSAYLAAPTKYTNCAEKLYKILISPIERDLKKRVIIIPDGILGYIPFEALIREINGKPYYFNAHKYFIDDHQVSYCYSANLLNEMQSKTYKTAPTNFLLAMAPFSTSDTILSPEILSDIERKRDVIKPLPNSGQEVTIITKLMNGTSFYGKEARINKFLELAPSARIIHLATHSKANSTLGNYSYLAFNDTVQTQNIASQQSNNTFLFARDLYNISLNADMVVLSACETGIGEIQRGEGIISMARAFSYAGAKSIVTSLWEVSDEKTKILMTDFYKFIKRGMNKDEALWRAKREFMKKTLNDPYYWASFIAIGNMSAIKK